MTIVAAVTQNSYYIISKVLSYVDNAHLNKNRSIRYVQTSFSTDAEMYIIMYNVGAISSHTDDDICVGV